MEDRLDALGQVWPGIEDRYYDAYCMHSTNNSSNCSINDCSDVLTSASPLGNTLLSIALADVMVPIKHEIHKTVEIMHFTKEFLYKTGFEWPYIDINYIRNYFKYLIDIGYFNMKLN